MHTFASFTVVPQRCSQQPRPSRRVQAILLFACRGGTSVLVRTFPARPRFSLPASSDSDDAERVAISPHSYRRLVRFIPFFAIVRDL